MADDHESLDPGAPFIAHLLAGALAGTTEHCAMFPIDTLKTRVQAAECLTVEKSPAASSLFQQAARSASAATASASAAAAKGCNACAPPAAAPLPPRPSPSTFQILRTALRTEGLRGLYKGFGAAVAGAGPAHAIHFATYEYVRALTAPSDSSAPGTGLQLALATGSAAAVATVFNDAVMTPADLIKQRMQVTSSPFKSSLECLLAVVRKEGVATLFRGYQTALFMNVPFTAIHFAAYETSKVALGPLGLVEEGHANHLVAGALAGGAAAALTTPFDVVKTRLQTEGLLAVQQAGSSPATTTTPPSRPVATERGPGQPSTSASTSTTAAARAARTVGSAPPSWAPPLTPSSPEFAFNPARAAVSASGAGGPRALSTSTTTSNLGSTTAAGALPEMPVPCGKAQERLSVSPLRAMRQIAAREGWPTLLKGLGPRVLFHMPSAAICWATYEGFKGIFLPMFAA